MCGLAGVLDQTRSVGHDQLDDLAYRMADTLETRGPDDRGAWVEADAGLALGFRRLAIVDLSPEGHQPMRSACGRFVLAFNGEIYNHHKIREELLSASEQPPLFRGHSDTEVMLAAFARWGVEASLKRFVGMFAFALWDRHERTLTLARDRIGEKPLYYGWMGSVLLFGSELKALRAHPAFQADINRDALVPYLRRGYIPGPYSIYKGVWKLPPGCFLTLKVDSEHARETNPVPYWSAREVAERGQADPFAGSDQEAVDELESLLKSVIANQMIADVPLGAFLSGGIDSSTVVALMQAQSSRPVRTFTIGFQEAQFNEAEHAKAVARHLGTDHTELYVTPEETLGVLPQLPSLFDEPFADSSQIPTFLVAQMARRHVTVSLSGDGGDELFGGYERHFRGESLWYRTHKIPSGVRRTASRALQGVSAPTWDRALGLVRPILPSKLRRHAAGDRLHRAAELISHAGHPAGVFDRLSSQWDRPSSIVIGSKEPATLLADPAAWPKLGDDLAHRLMYIDLVTYLPDDILVKVDRASMGVSLESRAPMLDHRVVEFAWRLPKTLKVRQGRGKWPLRQLLDRYVPRTLTERPKMGFAVPVDSWLRGPLRDWASALLDENRLRREGLFEAEPIRKRWEEHRKGQRNWKESLWTILMFQAWMERQK